MSEPSTSTTSTLPVKRDSEKSTEKAPRIYDSLFSFIEETQSEAGVPFGRLLDSGTGSHSLRWIAGLIHHHLETEKQEKKEDESSPLYISSYTAVTADEQMRKTVFSKSKRLQIDQKGEVVIGNWADSIDTKDDNTNRNGVDSDGGFLAGEMYDTILADYLIGAMDGFSPYYQDRIIPHLQSRLNPGGYLYIVGLEPIPDSVSSIDDPNGEIMVKVTKVRDACILLAGHRCYREYPLTWITRQIQNSDKLELVETKKYPIMYSHETISRQIKVARSKLNYFHNEELKEGMKQLLDSLEEQSKQATQKSRNGRIKFGFDYVVCAKRIN